MVSLVQSALEEGGQGIETIVARNQPFEWRCFRLYGFFVGGVRRHFQRLTHVDNGGIGVVIKFRVVGLPAELLQGRILKLDGVGESRLVQADCFSVGVSLEYFRFFPSFG